MIRAWRIAHSRFGGTWDRALSTCAVSSLLNCDDHFLRVFCYGKEVHGNAGCRRGSPGGHHALRSILRPPSATTYLVHTRGGIPFAEMWACSVLYATFCLSRTIRDATDAASLPGPTARSDAPAVGSQRRGPTRGRRYAAGRSLPSRRFAPERCGQGDGSPYGPSDARQVKTETFCRVCSTRNLACPGPSDHAITLIMAYKAAMSSLVAQDSEC